MAACLSTQLLRVIRTHKLQEMVSGNDRIFKPTLLRNRDAQVHPRFHITRFQVDNSSESGFSLIEIMVAIAIGLVLMGGVLQVFISTRQSTPPIRRSVVP